MELEEAIEILLYLKNDLDKIVKRNAEIDDSGIDDNISTAIETVISELDRLQKENTMLENTKMNCPHLNTSGVSCSGKFCNLEDYISKDNIRDLIENEVINISGFKCIAVEDLEDLLKEE